MEQVDVHPARRHDDDANGAEPPAVVSEVARGPAPPPPRPSVEVWATRAVVLLTVLGCAVRIWVAWRANVHLPDDATRLTGDEPGYDYVGWTLAQGHRVLWPGRAPGYPALLALVYLFGGHTYEPVLYVQAVVGAAAIPLAYLVARRVLPVWWAVAASALVAFHPSLVWEVEHLLSEVLFTPLVLLAVVLLQRAIEAPSRRRLVAAGAAAGAMTLCRPTTLVFFVVVPLVLGGGWRRRLRAAAVYAAALLALIVPVTIYNAATYHAFLPVATSTGVVWQGSPAYWDLVQAGRPYISIWENELNPAVNGGHDVTTIEGDRWFTRRGIHSILGRPLVYGWYSVNKVAYLWVGSPAADWGGKPWDYGYVRTWLTRGRAIGTFYSRLLPVAAAGALVLIRRDLRRYAAILAVLGYFTAVHALTYAEVRHSEPLSPLVDILVVAGVAAAVVRFRALVRRRADVRAA